MSSGDQCICGAAIWHPCCYASFHKHFGFRITPKRIKEWRQLYRLVADPVYRVVERDKANE